MSQRRAEKLRRRARRAKRRTPREERRREEALIEQKGIGYAKMQELVAVIERDRVINLQKGTHEPEEQPGSEAAAQDEEAVS